MLASGLGAESLRAPEELVLTPVLGPAGSRGKFQTRFQRGHWISPSQVEQLTGDVHRRFQTRKWRKPSSYPVIPFTCIGKQGPPLQLKKQILSWELGRSGEIQPSAIVQAQNIFLACNQVVRVKINAGEVETGMLRSPKKGEQKASTSSFYPCGFLQLF